METTVFISIFIVYLIIFYWKTVKLYNYTINCFENICNTKYVQDKYRLVVNGRVIDNVRISTFGTMYLTVVIPEDVEPEYFDEYLETYLTLLEQAMVSQNLYGLVKTKKEKFLVKSDEDVKNAIFYIKFVPILYKNTYFRFICFVLASLSTIFIVNHFELINIVSNLLKLVKV